MRVTKPVSILSVLVLAVLALPLVVMAADRFGDVPDENIFHDDISWMDESGITHGCNPPDNTNYCPTDDLTREQMAAFLHRLAQNRVVDAATVEGHTVADIVSLTGGDGEGPDLTVVLDRLDALEADVATLETQVASLETQVDDQDTIIVQLEDRVTILEDDNADLEARLVALETLLDGVTRDDPGNLLFTGMNLQVVNGEGSTDTTNGLGNLIIGYNTDPIPPTFPPDQSGSHYLVVGDRHGWSSYGGIVAGFQNLGTGPWATITGGSLNEASAFGASVTGGVFNQATGSRATVTGGAENTASGQFSSVTGGRHNVASGLYSAVSGGGAGLPVGGNLAGGEYSSVSGGENNEAGGVASSVLGGQNQTVAGDYGIHPN